MGEVEGQVREEELDAQGEARKRLALAQIRQYPDSALRLKAREVDVFDEDLGRVVERMKALMHDANGVGLAANQVGILQRVFVFVNGDDGPQAVVNPRVLDPSAETVTDAEGCLSLQGVHVPVERAERLTLEGVDETGAPLRLDLADLEARVVQHELDHLDGTLILDRTDAESRRGALATLRQRL